MTDIDTAYRRRRNVLLGILAAVSCMLIADKASAENATEARTSAYLFDGNNLLTMDSTSFYDIANDAQTAEIKFADIGSDTVEAAARAAPGDTDSTFSGIRVYFHGMGVQVTVDGNCETSFITDHGFHFSDIKIFQGGTEIAPSSSAPPVNDFYAFDGGSVTLNEVTQLEGGASITAIDLRFDTGERHQWGFASAAIACLTPVDLQSFEVD